MAENATRAERVFRALLRFYPRAFRDRFGEELVSCFRRDRERPHFAGFCGQCRFWTHTVSDLFLTAFREWRADVPPFRLELDMYGLLTHFRFAFRSTWRHARVTMVAAGTLAIGIGASTAILSVTKSVLLGPLPYRDSERLSLIWSESSQSGFVRFPISGPELNDLRERSDTFEEFASIWTTTGALVEENEPETVALGLVTWNFPSLLGIEPVLGRSFEPAEEGTFSDALLISEGLWRRRFGAEASVLGKSLRIDGGWGFPGGRFTVIGVLPASFRLILPSDAGVASDLDVLIPFGNDLAAKPRGLYYLRTIGRALGLDVECALLPLRHE